MKRTLFLVVSGLLFYSCSESNTDHQTNEKTEAVEDTVTVTTTVQSANPEVETIEKNTEEIEEKTEELDAILEDL